MNGIVGNQLATAQASEIDIELRRLREKIEGLGSTVSILLERLQPVTRQVPPRPEGTLKDEKTPSPESQLGNEISAASREVVNITMRLRERMDLLAI